MIIPVGFSQVNLIFTGAAVPLGAQMTFGVENTTALDPLGVAALVDAAWVAGTMPARQPPDISLTGILVKNGPNSTGASAQATVSRPGSGTGSSLAPNTAVLIRKFTASGGRKGRGRMFLPGISETTVDSSGIIAPASVTAMQTSVAAFRTSMISAAIPPVLLHTGTGGFADLPTPITGFTVENRVATQRRRLRR